MSNKVSWIEEEDSNAEQAKQSGKSLVNEKGIKTEASKGITIIGHPWEAFKPDDKKANNAVSSIKVNDFTKAVLTEFKDKADTSERKIFIALVNQFAATAAEAMENGEELTVSGVIKRMSNQ